jgi:DNA polymerase I-like protein with 3'-5' exonuclease and polymerase domains
MALVFDLETDGLLNELTKIHTLSIFDTTTNKLRRYDKSDVPKGLKRLANAEAIVGHNIIAFDIPAIKKVHPRWDTSADCWDTLVWARLLYPDIKYSDFGKFNNGNLPGKLIGSHSLETWGYRLGEFKGEFAKQTDWSEWSLEMADYCEQDVRVTVKLMNELDKRTPTDVKREALDLEHKVQWIIARQERYGFYFDYDKALQLYAELLKRKNEIYEQLHEIFPPFYVANKEFIPKVDNMRFGYVKGAKMTQVKQVSFNPTSNYHIYWMFKKKYGWEPMVWTDTPGLPKIDEDVLQSLKYPEAKLIQEYWTISKRMGQIHDGNKSWLKFYNQETGRLYGGVNSNGTVTGRMTHFKPHLGQVPSNDNPWGERCRELFTVPKGKKLVGCDASSLEMRCLAHYIGLWDQGEFGQTVIQGSKEEGTDPHTLNMKALGIDSRHIAKTWFYAWLYGAGNTTLATYLGCSVKKAKQKNDEFLSNSPYLNKLKKAIDAKVKKKKYLKGLDNRRLLIRSAHSALNTLLQSAGAIIMKKALVFLDDSLQEQGFIPGENYEFVANVHDEWQIECDPEIADTVGQTAVWAIEETGRYFNLNCPITGDYDVGDTWKETH